MFKRFGLFIAVNFAIVMMLMLITRLLGLGNYFSAQGIDYQSLFLFCLVWGMGGAFISLALSKRIAKWTMGLRLLSANSAVAQERYLYATVARLAQLAGIGSTPEVAVYDSPEINAFATGPSRNSALVAVSSGLLAAMNEQEVEGVLAHEVSHIANGDMVTMTLVQGVMNAFVMFFSKAVAWVIANFMSQDEENSSPSFFLIFALEMFLYVVFGLIAAVVVSAFSRYREYAADKGGARLAGTNKMIAALRKLQTVTQVVDPRGGEAVATLKIASKNSWLSLLSTHPCLKSRIDRLHQY